MQKNKEFVERNHSNSENETEFKINDEKITFETIRLMFSLGCDYNVSLNQINGAINRMISTEGITVTNTRIPKKSTIKNYFRYLLPKLNSLHFSFIICTDPMFKKDLCYGWDETSKRQKTFECLRVTGGMQSQRELSSMVSGYIRMPSKTANHSVFIIKHSIDRINKNINLWKQYKNQIVSENFNVNFNKFDEKICALNGDRAATNFSIQRKLNQNTEIEINVNHNFLFNCLTHDLNSLTIFNFFLLETEMHCEKIIQRLYNVPCAMCIAFAIHLCFMCHKQKAHNIHNKQTTFTKKTVCVCIP